MVRATFAGFDTALSALRMNQKRLDIVGQNLANMNVTGYTRQTLNTSSLNYENPTSFYMNENDVNVGFGVHMDEVVQLRDQFLDKQYRTQNAKTEYNSGISDSLKSLTNYLDETDIDSIRAAFDDIQTSLTTMQDLSKVQDPIYESDLMGRMQAMTNLLNTTAESIGYAEIDEFHKLDGTGTDEAGAVDRINVLLMQIGQLNVDIKHNQIFGYPSLEMQDQRNVLIDELSGYIPIEVESFSETYTVYEKDKDGKDIPGTGQVRSRIYSYDENGNVTGRSDWPEDLRINLVWTEYTGDGEGGAKKMSMTLVNGAIGEGAFDDTSGLPMNVGRVEIAARADGKTPDASDPRDTSSILDTQLTFTAAYNHAQFNTTASAANASVTTGKAGSGTTAKSVRFNSGSVQASLDMLSTSDLVDANGVIHNDLSTDALKASKYMDYYSYDYYMDRLDALAKTFAKDMNQINRWGNTPIGNESTGPDNPYHLLVNKDYAESSSDNTKAVEEGPGAGITALNIGISKNWINGKTHIGTYGFEGMVDESSGAWKTGDDARSITKQGNATDTVLKMLEYMNVPTMQLSNRTKSTYTDYMNNISTVLATDAYNNQAAYKINDTVLKSIDTSRDQLSGVSLDEEAANMMTFTTAYNASARLMTTLDEVLNTLINIKR